MRVQTLIKFVAAILVFTILVCTLMIVKRYMGDSEKPKSEAKNKVEELAPERESAQKLVKIADLRKKLRAKNTPEVVLGLPAFAKARRMLEAGAFAKSRRLLEEITLRYEGTPAELEAYRVLGEMNLDDLFTVKPGDGKIHYKVKSGDSYLAIVEKYKTNFDLMLQLNGLSRTDRLRPNDKLVLMPLKYSLRIVPELNQLFLLDPSGRVIKLYEPVVDMTIPLKTGVVDTRIERLAAYANGRRVNATRGNYREADKVIKIISPKLEIRGESDSIPKRFVGVVLKKADMEELMLLFRSGNSVKIRY